MAIDLEAEAICYGKSITKNYAKQLLPDEFCQNTPFKMIGSTMKEQELDVEGEAGWLKKMWKKIVTTKQAGRKLRGNKGNRMEDLKWAFVC